MEWQALSALVLNSYRLRSRQRTRVVWDVAGTVVMVSFLVGALALPYGRGDDTFQQLRTALGTRYPGYSNLVLARLVAADTVVPFLLAMSAAFGAQAFSSRMLARERRHRTLEPLFLLPVSEKDILFAAVAAACMQGLLRTWLIYAGTVGFTAMLISSEVAAYLLNGRMILMILLTVPALTLFSSVAGVVISGSVADSRTAESYGLLAGVPIVLVFAVLGFGVLRFDFGLLTVVSILVIALDVVAFGFAVSRFQRERALLTRR